MIIALVIIFMILMLFLDRYFYHKFFTWPSIITIIWCITLSFALMGLYNTVIPSITTVLYAMLFIATLNIFSLIFSKYLMKNNNLKKEKENHIVGINDRFLSFVTIICIVLLIIICRESISVFFRTFDMSDVRNAFINYESIGVHMQVLFSITVVPIGKAVYVLSIVDYVHNKKIKLSLILSTVFSILCMLLTGGRGILVFMLFTFIVSLIFKEKNIVDILKNNKKIIKLCVFFVLIILLVTLQRGFGNNGVFTSVYVYFCGCFNLFEVYLRQGLVYPGGYLFGRALLSGVLFPFIEMLRYVFNINILPGNYILANEAVAQYIHISPEIAINATPTTMFTAIRDFGVAGLIIYPMGISYIYYKIKKMIADGNNILKESIFSYFIVSTLFLNLSYQFGTFQNVSVFIYMLIIYVLSKKEKVIKIIEHPAIILVKLDNLKIIRLSDEKYLKIVYKSFFNKDLNLNNPKTLNEKLQWLKLNDRKDIYTTMVDKYEAKNYISKIIGKKYTIPTLGIYDSFKEIDFSKLPNKFVIKCTHDSGGVVIVKDKSKIDLKSIEKKIKKSLKKNYYYHGREWPYKNVKPRILVEKYMVDESGVELKDYKIFCFNGKAEYVEVDFNRHIEHKLNPYDFDWKPLNFCDKSKNDYSANIQKPKKLDEMKKIAETLSKDMAFLRVDFYSVNDRIYVGELTLHPGSGFIQFDPISTDLKYGKKLDIGGVKK